MDICSLPNHKVGTTRSWASIVKAGVAINYPTPIQGPKHQAVLITLQPSTNPPLFPPNTHQFTASMGSIISCYSTDTTTITICSPATVYSVTRKWPDFRGLTEDL